MAEQSGVVNTTGGGGGSSPAAMARGKKGKNRLLWIGGAAGGLFLLMAHKGGGSGAPTDAQNLQSASDALAAQEAAQANLSNDAASFSPAGVPVDTGGGSFTSQGPTATTSPAVDLTINTATPAGAGSGGGATGAPPPPVGTKPPPTKKPLPTGWKPLPGGAKKPKAPKGYTAVGLGSGRWGAKPTTTPKPKTPSKTKPAPAAKQPNAKGSPQHPETKKKTPSGARKKSPAEVESIDGFGSGITVMGRQFPGAISHRMGAPRFDAYGNICRDVTIDYGGRSETHTCHGNGRIWTDRTAGKNPPSRGVPVATDPIAI